jgi:hypothetical protein
MPSIIYDRSGTDENYKRNTRLSSLNILKNCREFPTEERVIYDYLKGPYFSDALKSKIPIKSDTTLILVGEFKAPETLLGISLDAMISYIEENYNSNELQHIIIPLAFESDIELYKEKLLKKLVKSGFRRDLQIIATEVRKENLDQVKMTIVKKNGLVSVLDKEGKPLLFKQSKSKGSFLEQYQPYSGDKYEQTSQSAQLSTNANEIKNSTEAPPPSKSSVLYELVIHYLPWVAPVFGADNLNAMKDNEKKFNSSMKDYKSFVDQTCTFKGSNETLREFFTKQSLRKPAWGGLQKFHTSAWKWLLAPLDESASTDARFIDVSKDDADYLSKSEASEIFLTKGNTKVEYSELLAKRKELQQKIKPLLAERDRINIELIKNLTKYESSSQNDSKKAVVGALIQYIKAPSTANWAAVTSATKENKGWDAGLTSRVRRMHARLEEVHKESIESENDTKPRFQ